MKFHLNENCEIFKENVDETLGSDLQQNIFRLLKVCKIYFDLFSKFCQTVFLSQFLNYHSTLSLHLLHFQRIKSEQDLRIRM